MNGDVIKKIFIFLIIILIICAVFISFSKNKDEKIISESTINNSEETIKADDIRIAITEFDNINPILSNNKNVQDISRLIFDSLFKLSEDYKLENNLAKECSRLNDTTYIVKLNEGIKWHDGEKFDSDDVIFTIDMIKNVGTSSVYFYNVKNISQLEKVDEYTIKITIAETEEYFAYNLIFPIVSSKYFNSENFTLESVNMSPVGTGDFYISEANNNMIILKKNENKNTESLINTITLKTYDSLLNTIEAFKTGEVDLLITANSNIGEYLKNTNYIEHRYINRKYEYLALNCNSTLLSNIEVRQAINSAINKEAIISEIYDNRYNISNFPLDFGSYAYNNNNSIIEYNENTAKNLLVDNGWSYSNKNWRKTVNWRYLKLELSLVVNKNSSNMLKVGNKIKEQLEKVGIEVKLVEATDEQYSNYINNKNYDLILIDSNYGYSPSLSKYFNTPNGANYQNEELNNLLQQINESKDENELKQIYSKIVEIYNNDVPYISLCYNSSALICSSSLKGNIKPNSYNAFTGIESWYREYKNNN